MSDWHDEFTEPMHDTPADKDPLIAAMESAGYTYDGLESTNENLRFFGEGGQVITMGGWHECEEWLNGVVFDDPQVMNRLTDRSVLLFSAVRRKEFVSKNKHQEVPHAGKR